MQTSIAVRMTMSPHCWPTGCRASAPPWSAPWPRSSGCWSRRRDGPQAILLRSHRPGDIGWMVRATARCMPANMAWIPLSKAWSPKSRRNSSTSYDASREHCWIAEIDGEPVGSVFLVKASDEVAKLRLLLVERRARARARAAAGRRMHRVSRGRRLSQDHAVDPEHPGRRAQDLSATPDSCWSARAAPQFRPKPDRRDLGIASCDTARVRLRNHADAPIAFGRRRCSSSRGMISTKLHGRVR